jgi:hypothetical protein
MTADPASGTPVSIFAPSTIAATLSALSRDLKARVGANPELGFDLHWNAKQLTIHCVISGADNTINVLFDITDVPEQPLPEMIADGYAVITMRSVLEAMVFLGAIVGPDRARQRP